MSRPQSLSRRSLLGLGVGLVVTSTSEGSLRALEPTPACRDTPSQPEGPYFPTRRRADEDTDLTRIDGRAGRAQGEAIHVAGQVLDGECRPIPEALVEIWQANTWGRYAHERDPNPAPLDPDFQGWGHAVADEQGRYGFRTIKPGPYPVGIDDWIRPPHIHFKVSRRGYRELVTQMYFAGEELNERDRFILELAEAERRRLIIAPEPAPEGWDSALPLYRFDVVLARVG